jgi:hypothetical protein
MTVTAQRLILAGIGLLLLLAVYPVHLVIGGTGLAVVACGIAGLGLAAFRPTWPRLAAATVVPGLFVFSVMDAILRIGH